MLSVPDSDSLEMTRYYDPSVLDGRIGEVDSTQFFTERILPYQVPCPWGDLRNHEGTVLFSGEHKLPYIPLSLEVGCGMRYMDSLSLLAGSALEIGSCLYSDTSKRGYDPAYLQMDLLNPAHVDLGGAQVHLISSFMVFSYDRWGVPMRCDDVSVYERLSEILCPGGLFAFETLFNVRGYINEALISLGFNPVYLGNAFSGVSCYQKPF